MTFLSPDTDMAVFCYGFMVGEAMPEEEKEEEEEALR
jgi:hypothetical protein